MFVCLHRAVQLEIQLGVTGELESGVNNSQSSDTTDPDTEEFSGEPNSTTEATLCPVLTHVLMLIL